MHVRTAGWLFYDSSCSLCCRSARRFGRILARRGFELASLHETGAAQRLRVSEAELLRETRLLLIDGRQLGGAEAILEIARHIWWAWPLWLVSRLPGVRPVLRVIYRIIAANRHCAGGVCRVPRHPAWQRWIPLLVLPTAAVLFRNAVPAWVFMWAIAFAVYAGFKWLTSHDALANGLVVPARTRFIYLLVWPGMALKEFTERPSVGDRAHPVPCWLPPAFRTLAGAGLIWFVVPVIPAEASLPRGWVGMAGIIMMLHFGTFHLLALTLRAVGFNARPNMQSPLRASSLADFWGRRWNTAFTVLADRYGFRPLAPLMGARAALVAVFIGSGLLHEAVITLPARNGYGLPTAYFGLQAVGILIERSPLIRRSRLGRRLFTWLTLIGPLGWLFPPRFVCEVILPMLQAIGATRGIA